MKRFVLSVGTIMAIALVLSVSMKLQGVDTYLNANGLSLTSLLIFATVMGFSGSFISLAIPKWSVKKSMGVQVIETPASPSELWMVETTRKHSTEAGIEMPEVRVFDAPEVNAFATGMSKNSSLIAFGIAGGERKEGHKAPVRDSSPLEERIAALKSVL